jgi:hypothetical protein
VWIRFGCGLDSRIYGIYFLKSKVFWDLQFERSLKFRRCICPQSLIPESKSSNEAAQAGRKPRPVSVQEMYSSETFGNLPTTWNYNPENFLFTDTAISIKIRHMYSLSSCL